MKNLSEMTASDLDELKNFINDLRSRFGVLPVLMDEETFQPCIMFKGEKIPLELMQDMEALGK